MVRGPATEGQVEEGGDEDAAVEDLVEEELFGTLTDGERGGAEIEEAHDVGGQREIGKDGEEGDEPGDVPGVVGAEEEHHGEGKGEGGQEKGGLVRLRKAVVLRTIPHPFRR